MRPIAELCTGEEAHRQIQSHTSPTSTPPSPATPLPGQLTPIAVATAAWKQAAAAGAGSQPVAPRLERPLCAQADDSPTEVNSYIELGEVLVARRAQRIVCHVQLIAVGADWEIKSVAVTEKKRRQGIGRARARSPKARVLRESCSRSGCDRNGGHRQSAFLPTPRIPDGSRRTRCIQRRPWLSHSGGR